MMTIFKRIHRPLPYTDPLPFKVVLSYYIIHIYRDGKIQKPNVC